MEGSCSSRVYIGLASREAILVELLINPDKRDYKLEKGVGGYKGR